MWGSSDKRARRMHPLPVLWGESRFRTVLRGLKFRTVLRGREFRTVLRGQLPVPCGAAGSSVPSCPARRSVPCCAANTVFRGQNGFCGPYDQKDTRRDVYSSGVSTTNRSNAVAKACAG